MGWNESKHAQYYFDIKTTFTLCKHLASQRIYFIFSTTEKMIPIHVILKPLVLGQEIQDSSFKSVFDRRGYILNLCCKNFTMLLLKIVHELNT